MSDFSRMYLEQQRLLVTPHLCPSLVPAAFAPHLSSVHMLQLRLKFQCFHEALFLRGENRVCGELAEWAGSPLARMLNVTQRPQEWTKEALIYES